MPYYPPVSSGSGAPTDATYITQTANGTLSAEQALSILSSGIMRVATTTGVVTSLGDTLPAINGGTGVSNAGTFTNANNTTITGGGTIALGGFTLTVPATGSTALLATANVFTANQQINAFLGVGVVPTYSLHVAPTSGATAAQTAFFRDATTTTGKTQVVVQAGAGNTTGEYLLEIRNTGGTRIIGFRADANIFSQSFTATDDTAFGLAQAVNSAVQVGINLGAASSLTWAASGQWYSTKDVGFARNGTNTLELNNGTAGQWGALKAGLRDSGTTTIVNGLTVGHQSSGTPAAGLGVGVLFNVNSTTTADQNAMQVTAEWVVATHASRTARGKIQVYDTVAREALRVEASGAAMIGFLGASAVARVTGGADVTNNVTSGGTSDTIANFTDLTVYANDAAAIRNDIYQLARLVKQDHDALRLYGLLT